MAPTLEALPEQGAPRQGQASGLPLQCCPSPRTCRPPLLCYDTCTFRTQTQHNYYLSSVLPSFIGLFFSSFLPCFLSDPSLALLPTMCVLVGTPLERSLTPTLPVLPSRVTLLAYVFNKRVSSECRRTSW